MASRQEEKVVTSSHIHNSRPFSKTHLLMVAIEQADKEGNRSLLVKYTHIHNIQQNSPTDIGNGESRQGKKQVTPG